MPSCTLPYCGKCELNIVVDIHGVEKELCVLVDTGFTSDTGFGLTLPSNFVNYAMFTGTGTVTVADGREVAVASIPDAKIKKIEQYKLGNDITIPALFMDGPDGAIGVLFLQRCSLIFNGPSNTASINF